MEYTVNKLARLAGISPRTLRYYDQIGLLRPACISPSGYRIYTSVEVDLLQQILYYRELHMPLLEISKLVHSVQFDRIASLRSHLKALEARQAQTEALIATLKKTIQKETRQIEMTDKEKFEGFKADLIQNNEKTFGKEARKKYGEEAMNAGNAKMMSLSRSEYDRMEQIAAEILEKLEIAVTSGLSPDSEAGLVIASLHKEWLNYSWTTYSPEAHKGLASLYVADERFAAYYDKNKPGCAVFLRDAILAAF